MKAHFFKFIALSIFLFGTAHARAELHEFTLKDGRTLKAEIVGYNAKLGKVELKREDEKRVPVKPTVFVEADQKYIREWSVLDGVRNERLFKVACKKVMAEKWKKKKLATEPVVLRDTEYLSNIIYGESGITKERESSEIKGFCLRIIATGSDGQTALREVFEPSSFAGKYKWPE